MCAVDDDLQDNVMDNAKPAVARQGDVLVGPERRRRWSLKEKLSIVAESLEDGAVVSHVAQRHGLRPQQLFDWRRQVREHVPNVGGPDARMPAFAPVIVAEMPRFARAARGEAGTSSSLPETPPALPSATIEIAIGAVAVRVTGPIDIRALTAVLRAVKAVTS